MKILPFFTRGGGAWQLPLWRLFVPRLGFAPTNNPAALRTRRLIITSHQHLAPLQVGPGVNVLCKVRARPCNKAVSVMNAQLQAQDAAEKEEGGAGAGAGAVDKGDEAPSAKRRRIAAFFVESDSTAGVADGAEAPEVIVAIRKGNILGTSFHPELTNDTRWHKYFVDLVKEAVGAGGGGEPPANTKPVGSEAAGAVPLVA